MTYEQAIAKMRAEKAMLERAADDMQTAQYLYAIGANDESVNLYASIQRRLKLYYCGLVEAVQP